nr:T9SS type A sorting domain-containing protein [Clostridiales bacterium]
VISIPAVNFCTVSFWQSEYWTSYYELHRMVVSTDGGATYDVLYEGFPPEEEPDYSPWEKIFASLAAYAGLDIQIGFYYQGNYVDQWFVDDVLVQYDYSGPEIVSLVGNEALLPVIGAYVNNELILNATVFDLSGVASVTGHYSIDGGAVVDLPFAAAKSGEELWTATIPAEAAAVTGTINFDMVDVGGLASPTTADFDIEFVTDTDAPVIKAVKNTVAFLNNPMNLEVVFEDESAITSCSGYFTTNQSSWYKFELTPAKMHTYTYLGTIPAQATEVFDNGFVYFEIADEAGNTLTSDQYQVQWLDGQEEVFEDFESGMGNWGVTGNWGLEEGTYTSATHALTESPNANYPDGHTSFAMWANPMDWTLYYGADISFWCKYDIEPGFDYMHFEGTGDNGMTWIRLATWDGEGVDWHQERLSMDAFVGESQVSFRFYFISDEGYNTNGMYIDDIVLNTYNADYAGPTIVADPYAPLFYEGALADYTDEIWVKDISGVAGLIVNYSVDGAAEESVLGTDTGAGNMWSFTIPQQAPGSQVNYRFTAVDASPRGNETEKGVYKYFAGDHYIYDAGIVSYYMTAEDNAAWAEKISIGGEWWFADLTTALIRNYADGSGHISADMVFHVWEDNAGVPGDEMIAPFDVTAEASPVNTSAMTRIDLRPYALRPNGDFWIGISAPYGIVYSTMESTDETGTTAYQRSYTGAYNGTNWDWTLQALDNWHFRAVMGEKVGIEENNVPAVTELKQNYPNPFNPTTTINFNLAKDSKVSLVVYDVMGRKVADLVNNNMVSGSHKVSFDASNLVSGVYYYTLKAGEVNQTKKMMLIK